MTDRTRTETVTEQAELAFWAKVAECYPEATNGDLDPIDAARFTQAATEAVRAWARLNVEGGPHIPEPALFRERKHPEQADPPCGHLDCVDYWKIYRAGGGKPWCLHCAECDKIQDCECGFNENDFAEKVLRPIWGDRVEIWHTGGGCMNPVIKLSDDEKRYVMFSMGWYPQEASFSLFCEETGDEQCMFEVPAASWCGEHSPQGHNVPLEPCLIQGLIASTLIDFAKDETERELFNL